ncbi:MAG TPA: nitrous oxide reductase family maturation protein NosD [Ignavibacteriaceae bacterium]|nr:nitrous oxide reductase family maturation protein NosD [Ignavibacteriaceae bacterium]
MKIYFSISCIFFFLLAIQIKIYADKIIVDKNTAVNSVSKAIEIAKPYDEIIIKSGNYKEGNIIITKPLRFIGEDSPVIDGENQYEIFTVHADDVSISGIIFKNAGVSYLKENAAVRFENTKNGIVSNCRFFGNFFGVYLAKSRNCKVINNYFEAYGKKETSSGNGIHLWYCRESEITGNKIKGHRDGIYLEFVTQTTISKNYGVNNLRYGLHFMFSDSCRYYTNHFEKNSAGVAVMYSRYVDMEGNMFSNNWGPASYGLLLKDISRSKILKNYFIENTTGIFIEGCDGSEFLNNQFEKNGWAIKLMANSMENIFSSNNFVANTFDLSTNSRQNFNKFNANYWSKYDGYDLDKDGIGDVPYRPVKLYSIMAQQNEPSLILLNSLFIDLLNIAESVFPSLTPETLIDQSPLMRKLN